MHRSIVSPNAPGKFSNAKETSLNFMSNINYDDEKFHNRINKIVFSNCLPKVGYIR